jgi:cation diffusion facilitator family transporter
LSKEQTTISTTYFSIVANIGLTVIKGLSGIWGNSYALIADAIESAADVCSSILLLFGLKYAHKPADENHPYGHGRLEPIITFVVVGFLIASAIIIAHQSIINIQTPHALPKKWTLLVLGAIIIWKEISFQYILKKSKESNSTALKAEAWHQRSDAITSIAAFVGVSIAIYYGQGYETADDWAALFASAFILYNCYLIFRPALGELMDEHVHDDLIKNIREVSINVAGVKGTEKCFVRKVGLKYHVDLHARVDGHIPVKDGHEIAHLLKDTLHREIPHLGHILIHVEPFE